MNVTRAIQLAASFNCVKTNLAKLFSKSKLSALTYLFLDSLALGS